MNITRHATLTVLLAAGGLILGNAQTITPRQLWNDDPEPAKPTAAAKPAKPKTAPAKQRPQTKAQPERGDSERVANPAGSGAPTQSGKPSVPVIPAGLNEAQPPPLAFRYTLYKVNGPSRTEVSPTTRFRSGDNVQLAIEANREAYIYVVAQGSSGVWRSMLPSQQTTVDNRIPGRRAYYLPSERKAFEFDNQPGEERLFVVLSSDPIADLDGLLYSLRDGDSPRTDARLLAKGIDNSLIAKIRERHSRDLIIVERMDEEPEAQARVDAWKHAVYVANMKGGRVIGDLSLVHQ